MSSKHSNTAPNAASEVAEKNIITVSWLHALALRSPPPPAPQTPWTGLLPFCGGGPLLGLLIIQRKALANLHHSLLLLTESWMLSTCAHLHSVLHFFTQSHDSSLKLACENSETICFIDYNIFDYHDEWIRKMFYTVEYCCKEKWNYDIFKWIDRTGKIIILREVTQTQRDKHQLSLLYGDGSCLWIFVLYV